MSSNLPVIDEEQTETFEIGLLKEDEYCDEPEIVSKEAILETYGIDIIAVQTTAQILCIVFVSCSTFTFFSSAYSGAGSPLDAIIVMLDAVCIDVVSAMFVLVGVLSACMYTNMPARVFDELACETFWSLFIDLYVSSICSLLLGSIHALLMHAFKWSDVWFTVLECVTTLRTLDFQQSQHAPHSMNVTVWPVQSIMWCLFAVRPVIAGNRAVQKMFPSMGSTIITGMSIAGILLFTVFGMLHSHSNIFYANACSVTYRSMEFNLGVHLWYLQSNFPEQAAAFAELVQTSLYFIYLLFFVIWWSEVGTEPSPDPATEITCLRLYHRNSCLHDHQAFFLRGCFLGVALVLRFNMGGQTLRCEFMESCHASRKCLSAIAFCWPVAIAVRLVLIVTFGDTTVDANRAVVSVLAIPILLFCMYCYDEVLKPVFRDLAQPLVTGASRLSRTLSDCVHTCPV